MLSPECATFHPTRPHFLIATRQSVRIYDLTQQTLIKTLKPGAKRISAISVHPGGDNVLVATYDRRLLWHDLELDPILPYKTLRYHSKAIRSVAFNTAFPLFADASDDGTIQVFHAEVAGDGMSNAKIVRSPPSCELTLLLILLYRSR